MRLTILMVFVLITGCASNSRIPPSPELATEQTIRLVILEHEPVVALIESLDMTPAMYQGGAIAGAAGGLITGLVNSSRQNRADARVAEARKVLSAQTMSDAYLDRMRQPLMIDDQALIFQDVILVPRPENMVAFWQEKHLIDEGVTMFIYPSLTMTPHLDTAQIGFTAEAYSNAKAERLYRSTFECRVTLIGKHRSEQYLGGWVYGTEPLLTREFDECLQSSARLAAADILQVREYFTRDLSTTRKEDPYSNAVRIRSFDNYELLRVKHRGFRLQKETDEFPLAFRLESGWQRMTDENMTSVIANGNAGDVRKVARLLIQRETYTQPMLDVVAARLVKDISVDESEAVDAAAWLCRVIGESNDPRFRQALTQVIQGATDGKLKKYAEAALRDLPTDAVEQFDHSAIKQTI